MLSVVFVIAALVVSGTTASTVTAMCETGPKVTFSITGATDGSTVFSVGTGCDSTVVAAGVSPHIHVMTASAGCTFSATNPITLVIQKSNIFLTSSDEVFEVTCGLLLLNPQEASVTLTNAALQASSAVSLLGPTVTFQVTDNAGQVITTASIGIPVNLKVFISEADNAYIGFSISKVTFTVDINTAVTVIDEGCPVNGAPMPATGKQDIGGSGVKIVQFGMFVPITAGTWPDTPPSVSIGVTVTLCVGNCELVSCPARRRKRRSADQDVLTLTRPLMILPPGMSVVTRNETINNNGRTEAQEMPIFSTALIATVVALGVVLALCILVSVFMFCRLRRHMDASDSKKLAFENKAFN